MREDLLRDMYGKIAAAKMVATMLGMAMVVDCLDLAAEEILREAAEVATEVGEEEVEE